jgi:hypothetical protein
VFHKKPTTAFCSIKRRGCELVHKCLIDKRFN